VVLIAPANLQRCGQTELTWVAACIMRSHKGIPILVLTRFDIDDDQLNWLRSALPLSQAVSMYQSSGVVEVLHDICMLHLQQVTKCHSFLDYIFGGLQINFTVCFTNILLFLQSFFCYSDKINIDVYIFKSKSII